MRPIAFVAVLGLAIATGLSALPAAAQPSGHTSSGLADESDAKFPMTAAEFRDRIGRHIERARARMEEHIANKQLPQDRADEMRAHFKSAVAQIQAKVDEVCADGTVTKDEADAVHDLARSLLHHHRG